MTSLQHHKSGGLNTKSQGRIRTANRKRGEWGFLIMWEFQVCAGMKKHFEKGYGPEGEWARLFAQDEAYIGTELIHDLKGRGLKGEGTYVTLDFWQSQEAYDAFRKRHLAKYKALDQKCEEMTESEREIGRFARVSIEQGSILGG